MIFYELRWTTLSPGTWGPGSLTSLLQPVAPGVAEPEWGPQRAVVKCVTCRKPIISLLLRGKMQQTLWSKDGPKGSNAKNSQGRFCWDWEALFRHGGRVLGTDEFGDISSNSLFDIKKTKVVVGGLAQGHVVSRWEHGIMVAASLAPVPSLPSDPDPYKTSRWLQETGFSPVPETLAKLVSLPGHRAWLRDNLWPKAGSVPENLDLWGECWEILLLLPLG